MQTDSQLAEYWQKKYEAEKAAFDAYRAENTDVFKDVCELHQAICPEQVETIPAINVAYKQLRIDLITEEVVKELLPALAADDIVAIADGCVDAIVVIVGTMLAYGIPARAIWSEVHRTNMAKKDGPRREDGKRLKPLGWVPPDIGGIIGRTQIQHIGPRHHAMKLYREADHALSFRFASADINPI